MASNFGKVLKELRIQRGIRQVDLGKSMNLANNTISSWERGNSSPSLEELVTLAKFFNVSTDYLLGLEK